MEVLAWCSLLALSLSLVMETHQRKRKYANNIIILLILRVNDFELTCTKRSPIGLLSQNYYIRPLQVNH